MHAFKSFKDFKEGVTEMAAISKSISDVLSYTNDELPETSEEATKNLMSYVLDNLPSVSDEDFPNSKAISVRATEIGYKCPGHLAFGWKIFIDKDGLVYNFRVTINNNNNFARNTTVMKTAEAKGWKLVETVREKNPNGSNS